MLAGKIRVAYPVLLVVAGLGISLLPGVPTLRIDPDLIFIIFLPPLLYEAAWAVSWKEIWRWRRIICSFAFIVVFLTALSVAYVANHFIPGFSLALGFLLGGIVSPSDAVSAAAITKFVKVPRRLASILEGESLLNDATSLIIVRFALLAVAMGQFIVRDAGLSFSWMLAGGIGIGVGVGWVFMQLHKRLPTDVNTDFVLTLIAPFAMYLLAEEVGSSGVLAVVSGGLLLARRPHLFLESSSRLRNIGVWDSIAFLLNGLVFMFIGLELPQILEGLGPEGILPAVGYGLLITAVLVVGRILAAYGSVLFTTVWWHFFPVADKRPPGWKAPLLFGWTGMRGVLSLAAALSVPVQLANGNPFPQRNLILFITFVVIVVTLLVQGLTLPALIRWLNLPDPDAENPPAETDALVRKRLAQVGLDYLKSQSAGKTDAPFMAQLLKQLEDREALMSGAPLNEKALELYRNVLNKQRDWLQTKNKEIRDLDEALVRKHLLLLDLEEEKLEYL